MFDEVFEKEDYTDYSSIADQNRDYFSDSSYEIFNAKNNNNNNSNPRIFIMPDHLLLQKGFMRKRIVLFSQEIMIMQGIGRFYI